MTHTAAVLGLGRIALGYDLESKPEEVLSHTKAYLKHPGFRLVAGADPHPVRQREFMAYTGLPAYREAAELLEKHRPQVISVCTPTETHLRTVEEALEFQPRLILCEKPLASDLRSGQRIVDLCRARGTLLAVNYMRRFDPGVLSLRTILQSGGLGEIYKGSLFYSKGLLHSGSHYLDLLLDWLGPVSSFRVLDPGPEETPAGPEPDVLLTFGDACRIAMLSARERNFSVMELGLLGTKGKLHYGELGNSIEVWNASPDPQFPGYRILRKASSSPVPDLSRYQSHVIKALHAALEAGTPPASTGDSALAVLRLCEAITEAGAARAIQGQRS